MNNTASLHSSLFKPFVSNVPLYLFSTAFLYGFSLRFLYFTVFWCFQGVEKGDIENEWVKEIIYWLLPHFSLHWLIMWVGFDIKGSKHKSSVIRLNLFKVLIVLSTSILEGCAICLSDSSSSFSTSPSVITSASCSENSETIKKRQWSR